MARSHQDYQSHILEGVQLLIQYFEEILMLMCAVGIQKRRLPKLHWIDRQLLRSDNSNLSAPTAVSEPLPSVRSWGPTPTATHFGPVLGPISEPSWSVSWSFRRNNYLGTLRKCRTCKHIHCFFMGLFRPKNNSLFYTVLSLGSFLVGRGKQIVQTPLKIGQHWWQLVFAASANIK